MLRNIRNMNLKRIMKYIYHSASVVLLVFFAISVNAQSKVDVVKPYEPAIKDAYKISKMPIIHDTATIDVQFDYEIQPKPFQASFQPERIKPAKLKGEAPSLLERGYVLGGFGNYASPLFEARVHSLRSTNYQWNAYFQHESVNGKIKNQYGNKQFAGYSRNQLGAYGQRMFPAAVAYANVDFLNRKTYYYGRTLDVPAEDVQNTEYEKKDMAAQPLNRFAMQMGINSTHMDSSHLNYKLYARFRHTNGRGDAKEDKTDIGADLDYYFNHQFIGTSGEIHYIQNQGMFDTLEHIFVDFNPWLGAFGRKWRIQAGVNTTYDQKTTDYMFYPDVKLHYNIVSFIMVPYFEFTGNYKLNTFQDIIDENHFIDPSLYVKPTNQKQIISGGLRGNVSSRFGFNVNVTWKDIKDQYFYVDASADDHVQYFGVVYDNMRHLRMLAEVSWKKAEVFNVLVQASYNQYSLDTLKHAYYRPVYEINAHLRYNLKDKIVLTSDLFYKGERYAHDWQNGDQKMKDIFDIHVGGEYRYNHYLSGFVQFKNILAQKRYEWLNYRLLGFQFMVGASYRF
ncbi:TonB-dependent receptor [Salinivirga cyanobacteriivorans]